MKLDNLKIRTKLILIYIVCVLIPLIATNCFVFFILSRSMEKEQKDILENTGNRIEYEINQSIKDALSVSDYLYMDEDLEKFLSARYRDRTDFYKNFNRLLRNNVIRYYYTAQSVYHVMIYTDNDTITNGSYFTKKSDIDEEDWYRDYINEGQGMWLCAYYEKENPYLQYRNRARQISIIRKLDYQGGNDILKLDVDYVSLMGNVQNEAGNEQVYLCDKDKIIYTNADVEWEGRTFLPLSERKSKSAEYSKKISLPGTEWEVYVTAEKFSYMKGLREQIPVMVLLFVINLILPSAMIFLVNRSFRDRIALTEEYLNKAEQGKFEEITGKEGHDEIGNLIQSYNFMVVKIKELIEVVYRKNAEKQKAEVSKKQAELNALQSQINPHFMFNTLESIRMKSLINKEIETAGILEKFSVLLRKIIQWDKDFVTIEEETAYVKDYLDIQQYRFGERLAYSIYVQEDCLDRKVPKFTLLTIVENACVHGVESCIEGGTIHIVITRDDKNMYLEILDSGGGMDEEELKRLKEKINQASIEDLNTSVSIGVLNTVVRLQLYYDGKIEFDISSVKGEGTEIYVTLPLIYNQNIKNN